MNIFTQNKALLMKNLHKFYNGHEIRWVKLVREAHYSENQLPGEELVGSFWWKANLQLVEQYKALARCNLGDGRSAYFWSDLWSEDILQQKFPHLYSFVLNPRLTIQQVVTTEYLEDLFHLPLSAEAHEQFLHIEDICLTLRQSQYQNMTDTWSYIYGAMLIFHRLRHIRL